ncbi:hypothetical protein LB505_007696 [Fusarium chuoi]|nr:hypothetical protein LB505_007696 [Fusarium chuoi]
MRCCQPPAATPRVFEANCCCFYFCCAFLPLLYCAALYLYCQHFHHLIASARKESANMEGRARWGLPAEYLSNLLQLPSTTSHLAGFIENCLSDNSPLTTSAAGSTCLIHGLLRLITH